MKNELLTRRAFILLSCKLAAFGIVLSRMSYLQLFQCDRYRLLSEKNRIRFWPILPQRGQILDRNGVVLAYNEQNYRLLIDNYSNKELRSKLLTLSKCVDLQNINEIMEYAETLPPFAPILVKDNLSWKDVSSVSIQNTPGVTVDVGYCRSYKSSEVYGHVLGYIGAPDSDSDQNLPGYKVGKLGIEQKFNDSLRGSSGYKQIEVNSVSKVVRELEKIEPTNGLDVKITINSEIQEYAFKRISEHVAGTCVVLDVNTGEVICLASVPGYNTALLSKGISKKLWKDLLNDPLHPLTNRAIAGLYPPGSAFKIVVAAAAIEEEVISPKDLIYCPGSLTIRDHVFHCWKRKGHGHVSLNDAIRESCDVYFFEVARRIGINRIADFARFFGLGNKTGIELFNEKAGLVPTKEWKFLRFGKSWNVSETILVGIGQGPILTTPLQLAVMVSCIANGGKKITPTLIQNESYSSEKISISEKALAKVQEGLKEVCNDERGTGYRSRIHIPGLEMAGKTGTSQVKQINEEEFKAGNKEPRQWNEKDHAIFVGYAPISEPKYAVSVVIEHGGKGGETAAPIARDVLLKALQLRVG